jgi:nucleoside-diphosphate-sugar epimerase
VLELLATTDDVVLALVRPGAEGAEARLKRALSAAARAYGLDADAVPWARVRAVAGDVTQVGCGSPRVRFDVLWHSAASLKYEDRFEKEIFATNVEGTRNVLAMARAAGATVVNQVSTAYVVGNADGRIAEAPVVSPVNNNHYERSKVAAEALAQAAERFDLRILRPGIVVGHSRTLGATTFSGLYGFARQLYQFRGVMERMQKRLLQSQPLRLRVTPEQAVSLIPVDEVAAQAVHIGLQADARGVYHLTQAVPPTVGDAIHAVTRALGLADPEYVAPDAPLDWLDAQLDKRLDFYGSYIRGHKAFDRRRTDAALGDRADLRRPLPAVADLVAWYLERLEAERTALPAAR